ncbi:MAG: hypothetical protein KIPDCIKN_00476 [Haliscomenobacter sp.]|jgi:hypothetical protein|nr:hypothetical protein [Haliscomenobacter sp.]
MPTVFLKDGYRFHFYASDRDEPPHIHVSRGAGYAKIWLEPRIEPQYFYGYKTSEQREIITMVKKNETFLKQKWHDFFNQ